VIGNPPYAVDLTSETRRYFETRFPKTGKGYKNLALHFIECAADLTTQSFGYIVPKSITYSEGWRTAVDLLWPHLTYAADASRAWEDVLLEMVVLLADFSGSYNYYLAGEFEGRVIEHVNIDKEKWQRFAVIFTNVQDVALEIAENVWRHASAFGESVENFRGVTGWQNKCLGQGRIPVIRGDAISRYTVTPNVFLTPALIAEDAALMQRYQIPRIVAQNIVAHVTQPTDHIVIMAGLADDQAIPLDTVNNLVVGDAHWKPQAVLALINSRWIAWYTYRFIYNCAIRTMHLDSAYTDKLPLPDIVFTTPAEERAALLEQAIALYGTMTNDASRMTPDDLLAFVAARLDHKPEQADLGSASDVVHDLLAYLAEQMMSLHRQRQQLEKALDPFKVLERGAPFVTFTAAFADALKYGERLAPPSATLDIDVAHHDIDGLRLVPDGDQWQLEAQLKLHDPADEWRSWQYEEDGRAIARVWVPVYRLPLSEAQGRYYQAAFRVLDEFAHAKSFPGGRTRRTHKKLQLTRVPAFDADVDLAPLMELSAELAEVRARIAATDALIDQIVYRLYGLTEEEVAVVEGKEGGRVKTA
jgi:hypothetical protein